MRRWSLPRLKSSAFDYSAATVTIYWGTLSEFTERGHSLMVKFQPSKLAMRVRFPLPALFFSPSRAKRGFGAILCGYYTGLRLRNIADLEWSAVDLNAGIITVMTRKTRKKVTVPIHPQFARWLEKQTRGIGKAPVFPTLAGKAGGGKSGL